MSLTEMMSGKKVKKEKEPKAPKEKKEKVPRVAFVDWAKANRPALLNADSKLTAAPPDITREMNCKSPGKKDFADEATYQTWKLGEMQRKIESAQNKLTRQRDQIEQLKKYGDPANRAVVKKLLRLQEQQKELEAQLAKEGITI